MFTFSLLERSEKSLRTGTLSEVLPTEARTWWTDVGAPWVRVSAPAVNCSTLVFLFFSVTDRGWWEDIMCFSVLLWPFPTCKDNRLTGMELKEKSIS